MTTLFTRPRRYYNTIITLYSFDTNEKSLSHFIILRTPLMRPPRFLTRILWPNGGRINGVPLYLIFLPASKLSMY